MVEFLLREVPLLNAGIPRAAKQQVSHETERLDTVVVRRLQVTLRCEETGGILHYLEHLEENNELTLYVLNFSEGT